MGRIESVATPVGGIRGGKQDILSVGLNWYLNANLRIMTDYQWVSVDRLSSSGADGGQDPVQAEVPSLLDVTA